MVVRAREIASTPEALTIVPNVRLVAHVINELSRSQITMVSRDISIPDAVVQAPQQEEQSTMLLLVEKAVLPAHQQEEALSIVLPVEDDPELVDAIDDVVVKVVTPPSASDIAWLRSSDDIVVLPNGGGWCKPCDYDRLANAQPLALVNETESDHAHTA